MAGEDALLPIALLIDELRHDDIQYRMNSMRKLDTIAVALGPERTRDELIPFLCESVDDEDDVILLLAEQLGRFLPLIGGADHASVLLEPLETLAGVEELSVRAAAVASLNAIAAAVSAEAALADLWPTCERMGNKDWYTSRASACGFLPRLLARLVGGGRGPEWEHAIAGCWTLYQQLAKDDMPVVRRAAAAALADMATAFAGGAFDAPAPAASSSSSSSASAAAGAKGDAGGAASSARSSATGVGNGGSGGNIRTHDGLNVDTGDVTAAAVPPPVAAPVCVRAASLASGIDAATKLMGLADAFAADDQDSVRLLAVDTCVALLRVGRGGGGAAPAGGAPVPDPYPAAGVAVRDHVLGVALRLASDRAWRVRWSAANRLAELADAVGADVASAKSLLAVVDALWSDSEAEVRTAAAYRVADAARYVGAVASSWGGGDPLADVILPGVEKLSRDASEHVRAALASVVLGCAPVLGRDRTVETLLPLFLRLLRDSSAQVRLNVLSRLDAVNLVVGVRALAQALIPCITELSEDKQWRVRLAIIDFIPLLARQLGDEFWEASLSELCIGWLTDPVAAIREAAADNLRKLTEVFGPAWVERTVLPRLLADSFLEDGLYARRYARITAAITMAEAAPSAAAAGSAPGGSAPASLLPVLLPVLLGGAKDPVPNIRFTVAKALGRLAKSGRLDAATAKTALMGLAQDTDNDVKFFATQSLAAL